MKKNLQVANSVDKADGVINFNRNLLIPVLHAVKVNGVIKLLKYLLLPVPIVLKLNILAQLLLFQRLRANHVVLGNKV